MIFAPPGSGYATGWGIGGGMAGGMPNLPGLFPTFNPGPSSINTTYGKDGSVNTQTQAPGAPESAGPYQKLAGMFGGGMPQKPKGGFLGKSTSIPRAGPEPQERSLPNRSDDPLIQRKRMDQYEATMRGAATRPTGLGAQMIPGMAVDPRLLPSSMRPQNSQFVGQSSGPSPAGLSPSAAGQANALSSNHDQSVSGINYMSPAEQQRWLAAAKR